MAMPDRSRPHRPVVGSRNPTARPRKVAGRGAPADTPPVEEVPVEEVPAPDEPAPDEPAPDEPAPEEPAPEEPAPVRAGRLGGAGTTITLVAAIVLLIGVAVAEGWYLWYRDEPTVSASRPVVTGEIAHRAAVEAAAQSTSEILSYGYRDFDAQVDQATSKMTDSFAEQFRDTAADIEPDFVASKTEIQFKVVASSVVRASSEQVEALLFLNQFVTENGEGTDVTPYRALVTVVHTDQGWLVSNIETR